MNLKQALCLACGCVVLARTASAQQWMLRDDSLLIAAIAEHSPARVAKWNKLLLDWVRTVPDDADYVRSLSAKSVVEEQEVPLSEGDYCFRPLTFYREIWGSLARITGGDTALTAVLEDTTIAVLTKVTYGLKARELHQKGKDCVVQTRWGGWGKRRHLWIIHRHGKKSWYALHADQCQTYIRPPSIPPE